MQLMILVKNILKPYYRKLKVMLKYGRRRGLLSKDFSIVSNNCSSGYVYQYYGITYNTPTEGLYFITKDYIKLIERPEHYFNHDVLLIDPHESKLAQRGKDITYPVGIIDDIEVYFMHYPDPFEAIAKWKRRASRINYKKVFYLLTETELMEDGDLYRFVELMSSKQLKGVCLTMKDYQLPYTQYIPDVPKDTVSNNVSWTPNIIINSLNWKQIVNTL